MERMHIYIHRGTTHGLRFDLRPVSLLVSFINLTNIFTYVALILKENGYTDDWIPLRCTGTNTARI